MQSAPKIYYIYKASVCVISISPWVLLGRKMKLRTLIDMEKVRVIAALKFLSFAYVCHTGGRFTPVPPRKGHFW